MTQRQLKTLLTTYGFNRIRECYEGIQLRNSDFNYYLFFFFFFNKRKRNLRKFQITYYRLVHKHLFFNTTFFSIILNNPIRDFNIKNIKGFFLLYRFIFYLKYDLDFVFHFNFFLKYITHVYSLKGRKL